MPFIVCCLIVFPILGFLMGNLFGMIFHENLSRPVEQSSEELINAQKDYIKWLKEVINAQIDN